MELGTLIAGCSRPQAFPFAVDKVEVRQTHISVVFLAGPFAYKIKKPVRYGFLDYAELDTRLHFAREEVRLNRRLAPDVYLDVVPITLVDGQPRFEGPGEPIEWCVKMRRLPDEARLSDRLARDEVDPSLIQAVAGRVAQFHAEAERGEHIADAARFDAVAGLARGALHDAAPMVPDVIAPPLWERLSARLEEELASQRAMIEDRAARGLPRDTHGDLRLEHIYHFPDTPPPGELVVVDCIEFNERLRYADPVCDMAFLAMDLAFAGRPGLAAGFARAYFTASGDANAEPLLPLYTAYRSMVRGAVAGLKAAQPEVSPAERAAAHRLARAHLLFALGELETPGRRPVLILIGGLPGTGKSTLARELALAANCQVLRSDVVRKQLAGIADPTTKGPAGLYTAEWTERTYWELLAQADRLLAAGGRVIVDASFHQEHSRAAFLELGRNLAIPFVFFECVARAAWVAERLAARRGDASDADWSVYLRMAEAWEDYGPVTRRARVPIQADVPDPSATHRALESLQSIGVQ